MSDDDCPVYIIDAFTTKRFAGNQAAVCLPDKALPSEEYQRIAAEFNLSETCFPLPRNPEENFKNASEFSLRWFTPTTEVALCGHATLATSHVLFNEIENINSSLSFHTQSGVLTVKRHSKGLEMNFPAFEITTAHIKNLNDTAEGHFPSFSAPPFLMDLIRCVVPESMPIRSVAYAAEAKKLVVVIDEETTNFELRTITPNFSKMLEIHPDGSFVRGLMITLAPKRHSTQYFVDTVDEPYDYVSRYFAPWVGIREDPATGSAQCALAPYWSRVLGKKQLYAFQNFPGRGAQFRVQIMEGEQEGRVGIVGSSVTVVRGTLDISDRPAFY